MPEEGAGRGEEEEAAEGGGGGGGGDLPIKGTESREAMMGSSVAAAGEVREVRRGER